MEKSHAPPRSLLDEPSWELNAHWLCGTPGRIWEVLLCLHASRENPNNNCYLGQPSTVNQTDTHTHACELIVHAHTCIMEITRCAKTGQMRSLCSLWFSALCSTWHKIYVCTCIFLVGTVGNHVVSLSDETFQSLYVYTFWKPCWLQTVTERSGSVLRWPYVLVCVCNKTGSYILIPSHKELNPIHAAQTPNLSILQPNKLQRGRHLESACVRVILSRRLRKVVSTVMVLYCDWSSGITAGKSMWIYEKLSLCRCVCLCFGLWWIYISILSLFYEYINIKSWTCSHTASQASARLMNLHPPSFPSHISPLSGNLIP